MTRYKQILDVIVDDKEETGRYDKVLFDPDNDELPNMYRECCHRKNSSLYEIPPKMISINGKFDVSKIKGGKRAYQQKQADVTGIIGDKVILIVEEEKDPKRVNYDLEKLSKCNFMIDDEDKSYPLSNSVLFVLVQNRKEETESFENVGILKLVVICDKESFKYEYDLAVQKGLL